VGPVALRPVRRPTDARPDAGAEAFLPAERVYKPRWQRSFYLFHPGARTGAIPTRTPAIPITPRGDYRDLYQECLHCGKYRRPGTAPQRGECQPQPMRWHHLLEVILWHRAVVVVRPKREV
jgi:hypothetical protein